MLVRPLELSPRIRFALVWRDETPAPALGELIRAAKAAADPVLAATRPALVSVA
jgi:hypothetical protein